MTLFKQLIITGVALSLMCNSTLVEATIRVTSDQDDFGIGTLRDAITQVNLLGADTEIDFADSVNEISLVSTLPVLIRPNATITITGKPGLKIHWDNNLENVIFEVNNAQNTALHLVGNNSLEGTSNWHGGIKWEGQTGDLTLEQQVPSTCRSKISGPVNLIFKGTEPLILNNTSSYSGSTSINGISLTIAVTNALPVSTSVSVNKVGLTQGRLKLANNRTQTLAGLSGNSLVDMGNNNSILEIDSDTDSIFEGSMSGDGKLVKNGTGTFTLENNNSHRITEIQGGTLKADRNNALLSTGEVTIFDNATLSVAPARNQTLQSIRGNGKITIGTAGTLTAATVADSSFEGDITATGTGAFIKTGASMLTLSELKPNIGDLRIAAGGIKIPTEGSWQGPVQITSAGTTPTLEMNGGTVTEAITGDLTTNSILDITGIFKPTASIAAVGTIHVKAGGHFTINPGSQPTGFSNFTVNTGGTTTLGTNFAVPAAATLTNAGTFAMNRFNLSMNGNSIFNTGTLATAGSITAASGIGYALNVQTDETLTVNDPIIGYSVLSVANGGSVVLNSGGNLSNGVALNNSRFTFNGGSYSGNVVDAGGSTMNVNTVFKPPGSITVDTLNINAGGTFTPSTNAITTTTFNVRQGGTLFLENDLGGIRTLVNAGTITHTLNTTRTITGNFIQEATGTINIGITNPQQYSQLQVDGNTILNGGIINIGLLSNETIVNGQVFDIISSTGDITNNKLPTVSRPSLSLGFIPVLNGNKLQLITSRKSYKLVNNIPALEGTATGLDNLCANNPLNPLVGIIDKITSQRAFETLLGQLAPIGLNGVYTATDTATTGLGATERILSRLDTMREVDTITPFAKIGQTRTGYAADDIGNMLENQGSYGPLFFGNSTKQGTREGLPGYNALTTGFGFVGDAPILQHFRVGLGASYANSAVKQSNNTGSNTTIANAQGITYGSATYGPLFLDAVLSAGVNKYHGKRNITFFGQTATSSYTGFQYGTKIKTGFIIPCHQIEIVPTAGLQYMHLRVGKYTEQGAPSNNQSVDAMQFSPVRTYLGGKLAYRTLEKDFFPEIHAFYIVDVRNPNVQITSQFVDGGGSFVSTAVRPAKHGINVGASVSGLIYNRFIVSGGYDFEEKQSLRSHSLSFKFKCLF